MFFHLSIQYTNWGSPQLIFELEHKTKVEQLSSDYNDGSNAMYFWVLQYANTVDSYNKVVQNNKCEQNKLTNYHTIYKFTSQLKMI